MTRWRDLLLYSIILSIWMFSFLLYHKINNNIANITIVIVHYHAGRKNKGPLLGRSPESFIPFLGSEYPSRLGKDDSVPWLLTNDCALRERMFRTKCKYCFIWAGISLTNRQTKGRPYEVTISGTHLRPNFQSCFCLDLKNFCGFTMFLQPSSLLHHGDYDHNPLHHHHHYHHDDKKYNFILRGSFQLIFLN